MPVPEVARAFLFTQKWIMITAILLVFIPVVLSTAWWIWVHDEYGDK